MSPEIIGVIMIAVLLFAIFCWLPHLLHAYFSRYRIWCLGFRHQTGVLPDDTAI